MALRIHGNARLTVPERQSRAGTRHCPGESVGTSRVAISQQYDAKYANYRGPDHGVGHDTLVFMDNCSRLWLNRETFTAKKLDKNTPMERIYRQVR